MPGPTDYSPAPPRWPLAFDATGYGALLDWYVGGFRDGHIQSWRTDAAGPNVATLQKWPGYAVGLKPDGYRVVFVAPGIADAPAKGALLTGCDGQSVAALVQARDRFEGNLQLGSGRAEAARFLLRDRGNPFVKPPATCTFHGPAGIEKHRLVWRPMDEAERIQVSRAALGAPPGKLEATVEGDSWWLTKRSMEDGQDWGSFFQTVTANLAAIRLAPRVVIDLRGNGGGSSDYGLQLAKLLWGDTLVVARQPAAGPTIWRATPLNRAFWAKLVATTLDDKNVSAADKAYVQDALIRFDAAITAGKGGFTMPDDAPVARPAAEGPNPLRGRVILLTDHACTSACLDTMDLFTAMPNVIQAGGETSADTIFMELTIVDALPSGMSGFAFGHKAYPDRPRGSNIYFTSPIPFVVGMVVATTSRPFAGGWPRLNDGVNVVKPMRQRSRRYDHALCGSRACPAASG